MWTNTSSVVDGCWRATDRCCRPDSTISTVHSRSTSPKFAPSIDEGSLVICRCYVALCRCIWPNVLLFRLNTFTSLPLGLTQIAELMFAKTPKL